MTSKWDRAVAAGMKNLEFRKELLELFKRHRVYIWSCGCCEGAHIEQMAEKDSPLDLVLDIGDEEEDSYKDHEFRFRMNRMKEEED